MKCNRILILSLIACPILTILSVNSNHAPGDELGVAAEHLVPGRVVDHEEVGVVAVEGDVVAAPDLLVGVVAHLVELTGVGVDEQVVVLDVSPRAHTQQLQATAHAVPILAGNNKLGLIFKLDRWS